MDIAKDISKGLADRIVIAKARPKRSAKTLLSRLTGMSRSVGRRQRLGLRASFRKVVFRRIARLSFRHWLLFP